MYVLCHINYENLTVVVCTNCGQWWCNRLSKVYMGDLSTKQKDWNYIY